MDVSLPIENLLSDDERRQLEAVRLIALARDLLTNERERPIKARLDCVLKELDRFRGVNVRSSYSQSRGIGD